MGFAMPEIVIRASVHINNRFGLATGFCRHHEMTTAAAGVGQAAIGALVGQPGQRLGGGGRSWQGA